MTMIDFGKRLLRNNRGFAKTAIGSRSSKPDVRHGKAMADSANGYVTVLIDGSEDHEDNYVDVVTDAPVVKGQRVTISLADGTYKVVSMEKIADTAQKAYDTAKAIEADYVKATVIEAEVAYVDELMAAEVTAESITASNAYIDSLKAKSITADSLAADHAAIGNLDANYAKVNELKAANAEIADLKAKDATITGNLNAANAEIGKLQAADVSITGRLDAHDAKIGNLDASYVRADKANIDEAWINDLFVQGSFVSQEGTVYSLTGLHLNAGDITAGTLTVDHIAVKGSDGEYYMLSPNGDGTFSQVKLDGNIIEKDSLNADRITAHSITAEQLTVNNIVGTGGWINLAEGTFSYQNASTGNGISWDGSKLTLRVDELTIGSSALTERLDAADSAASAASDAASKAQSTADTAKANAATAQSTANTAKDNAAKAQTAADSATSAANTAQSTANTARDEAADAKKTATNYLKWDSTNGLVVTEDTGSSGSNVQIKSDSVNVRDGETVMASFAADRSVVGNESGKHSVLGTDGFEILDGTKKLFRVSEYTDRVDIRSGLNKELWLSTDYSEAVIVVGSNSVNVSASVADPLYANGEPVATKAYVDSKAGSGGGASGNYLPLAGGTMTGSILASGEPDLGSDAARWLRLYTKAAYFANSDGSYSSAYKFGIAQWDDKLEVTTRDASDNGVRKVAFRVNGSDAVVDFNERPTHDGSALALQSEIPSLSGYAKTADIAATASLGISNSAAVYVKISDFGSWGTGAWYQKGFAMLITSRAGEMVWVAISSDDSNTNAKAIRLLNTYGKIIAIYYSASESAVYVRANAWCNNINAHIISNINGDYVPTVAQVSALASDAVQITITELGASSSSTNIGDSTRTLALTGSATRPTYNGADLALQSDVPSLSGYATQSWVEAKGYLTALPSHTHSYLPLSGGTMTGTLMQNVTGNPYYGLNDGTTNWYLQALQSEGKVGLGPTWAKATKWDASGNMAVVGGVSADGAISAGGKLSASGGAHISGRYYGAGDDEGLIIGRASNDYAGVTLGANTGVHATLYLMPDNSTVWRWNDGSASYDIKHPGKAGTVALTSDIPSLTVAGTVLYNNSSGTTGTVTLSDSAANYSFLEIQFTDGSRYKTTRVYSPNGKATTIERAVYGSDGYYYDNSAILTISGTSITQSNQGREYGKNQTLGYVDANTGLKITQVVGWK